VSLLNSNYRTWLEIDYVMSNSFRFNNNVKSVNLRLLVFSMRYKFPARFGSAA
jgi:hypothetical protein